MKSRLKILLLEDDPADSQLIEHELQASGLSFDIARIETESELRQQMDAQLPDLILSDHGLPSFDGFRALEIVRGTRPEIPFIFVSGSNDPGMVAEMYVQGATDYVFKRDIGDLRTAVRDALQNAADASEPSVSPASTEPPPTPKIQAPPTTQEKSFAPQNYDFSTPLTFCPSCRQVLDRDGNIVETIDYLRKHAETTIVRALCTVCRASDTF